MTGIITALAGKWKGAISMIMFAAILLVSCDKTDPIKQPGNPGEKAYVQFTASGVAMQGPELSAIVSIETAGGQAVATNKKISLNYLQGKYLTDKIEVIKGELKLTKFIVVKPDEKAIYATPLSGSTKASLVTKALPIPFTVAATGVTQSTSQAAAVAAGDLAEHFGYSTADFGLGEQISLFTSLTIKVGEVSYQHLPGTLKVEALDANGNKWSREIEFSGESTNIKVPADYSIFNFTVNKWNTLITKQLSRQELTNNMAIELKGVRQAKRLVKEYAYLENSAGLRDDTRTEYYYTGDKLTDIKFFQRSLQVQGLPLTYVYKFEHAGNLVTKINRYDDKNVLQGETIFDYAGDKVVNVRSNNSGQQISGAVEYGLDLGKRTITTDFIFSNGNSMVYRLELSVDSNIASDYALSSTGGSERGIYEYDNNINPYNQLNYPDIYFTNISKNNRTMVQKLYSGNIPTQIPYKWEYSYDNDGYPTEVWISYKGYTSNDHLYRIKKVFEYQ